MLYLSEYANAMVLAGAAPIPAEPNLRTQVLEVGDASQVSEPFGPAVKFIRISTADEAVALKFGTSPVATPMDGARISANSTAFFAVQPGHRVAAVALGEGRDMEVFSVLRVLADPNYKARLSEYEAATAASNKAAREAKAATEEAAQAQAVLGAKQHDLDTRVATLEAARQDLEAHVAKLASDREALDGKIALAKTEDKRMADFEKRLAARDTELSERERVATNREKELAARADALKVAEAGYANRMARLKELAGGVQ